MTLPFIYDAIYSKGKNSIVEKYKKCSAHTNGLSCPGVFVKKKVLILQYFGDQVDAPHIIHSVTKVLSKPRSQLQSLHT